MTNPVYRHVKSGGLYEIITGARYEPTTEDVVVYRCLADGLVWVRSHKEFFDGRFEKVRTEPYGP